MTHLHADLLAVLEAVEIESPSRYRVLGVLREVPDRIADETGPVARPANLVRALANDLYDRLYIRPVLANPRWVDELARRDFLAALSAANNARGAWESGWTVRRIEPDGRVVVAKEDGAAFWADPAEVRGSGATLHTGDRCRVWLSKELRALVWGFYMAIGDSASDLDDEDPGPEGRFYWHLTSDAAVPFIEMATSLLCASQIPFRVKVPSHPSAYHRADAGVIYFRRRDDPRIDPVIARIHSAIAPKLRGEVPLFTRRLATGLGMAESPNSKMSFGEHRCRLVAHALWESFSRHEGDLSSRTRSLAAAFLKEDIDPLRPHLGSGANSDFISRYVSVEPPTDRQERVPLPSSGERATVSVLDAAAQIGRTLCRTAYWSPDGRLCNWIGRTNSEVSAGDSSITPTAAALGPTVYAGTAGIALFLSQLHVTVGNGAFRRTAAGAIAHAIRQFARTTLKAPISPLSFFSGDLGAAYVAWRTAAQLEQPELLLSSRSMIDRVIESASGPHMLDVIGGNAGAIPVLLAMGRDPGFEHCRALAILLGEELCRVDPFRSGVSGQGWDRPPGLELDEFTPSGFSHGASGLARALLELYAATGRAEFRDAARRSFAYEDTLFDPAKGNWADLRRPSGMSNFDRFWCNGAPGIALARLRAATLDPERKEENITQARVAIETTQNAIDEGLSSTRTDTSLCHGLSGLGEIILIAGELLDEPSLHARSVSLAQTLIDRYSSSGDWPSGVPSGGPNQSLMLGLAGIGYWLLRLHDPLEVPPVLLFIPT